MSASQPIHQAVIQQYARQLYLTTVADQFASLAEEAVRKKQSHLSYLEALLQAEIEERDLGGPLPGASRRPAFRRSRRWKSSISQRCRTSLWL